MDNENFSDVEVAEALSSSRMKMPKKKATFIKYLIIKREISCFSFFLYFNKKKIID